MAGVLDFDPNKPALLQRVPESLRWTAGTDAGWGASKALGPAIGGILGTFGRTLTGTNPVGAAIYGMLPNDTVSQEDEDAALAKNRQADANILTKGVADNWAKGVADRAAQAGSNYVASQYGLAPDQGVYPTPDGKAPAQDTLPEVANKQPKNAAQVVQTAATDEETRRQVVQQGAAQGLQTGAVSRPELAKAVVDSDAQRAGKQLTPDEHKAAVAEETAAMKTMDNNQLSKYVSYALIGGGLLAAAFDKSGRAGDAFAESYNRSLDRQAAARATNAKLVQEQLKTLLDYQIADRKATTGEKAQASQERYQGGLLDQGQQKIEQGDRRIGADVSIANARNATTMRGQDIRAATADSDRQSREDIAKLTNAVKIRTAKIRATAQENAAKGEPLTTKDATAYVKSIDESPAVNGLSASKAAQANVAQKLRNYMRANPTGDPAAFVHGEYQKLQDTGNWFGADKEINQYQ